MIQLAPTHLLLCSILAFTTLASFDGRKSSVVIKICSIYHDKQRRLMIFTYPQVNLNNAYSVPFFYQIRSLINWNPLLYHPSILSVIATFLLPFTMSKVLIKVFIEDKIAMMTLFVTPYPLVDPFMRNTRNTIFLSFSSYWSCLIFFSF